jgi:hypothetical protein
MQVIVHVPDDMIEPVKDKLPPPETGVLEAIALDAILGFLSRLEASAGPKGENRPQ